MLNLWKKASIFVSTIILACYFPIIGHADNSDSYSSTFTNQSDQEKTKYTLVKTRSWPESGCIVDSGKDVVAPGETTQLVILKKEGCDEAGIGYSLYTTDDVNKKNLLGYVSHRFRDATFSLQVSLFCKNHECIFRDLNPEQNR